jgi:hypothetical protein
VVVLAGRPRDRAGWDKKIEALLDLFLDLEQTTNFPSKDSHHRRGNYKVLHFGMFHGQGPPRPFIYNNDGRVKTVRQLRESPELQAVAGFQDGVFATWFPDLYDLYETTMKTVWEECGFEPNFPTSHFPAATANLGPQVQTFRHRDFMNYAGGVCLITCMGNHDPTKGGHLVLWELGIFTQFPSGSTVTIPSAIITHSNLPVAPHEKRVSFTQYAAGALFRWVDNGCKNDTEMDREERKQKKAARKEHFKKVLNYFTSIGRVIDMEPRGK